MVANTPIDDIPKIQADLRRGFNTGRTKSIKYRKEQLAQLAYMIRDHNDRWSEAIKSDLGRPGIESEFLDTGAALSEATDAYNNVEKWAKTEKAPWNFNWFAMKPATRKEPKGVVLIISPFNFPMLLLLGHLASAIAAGNAAVLKPSELTPAFCDLLSELAPKYLDQELYRVVIGDVPVVTKLLELPWDHLLYTGGARVAKIVAAAAAKHLTPVTTELGGKSPVFIDSTADLELTARRLLWGKVANAGQTCTAPDYVLIPYDLQDKFVEELKAVHKSFFPKEFAATDYEYSRIVSEAHAARLKGYLDRTKGKIVFGGETDVQKKFIAPTVLRDVPLDDSVMDEELFGPILPIIPIKDIDEGIRIVNGREHPLALYIFSNDKSTKTKIADNTQSGSVVVNEVVIQVGAHGLPFGGIGPSGSGYLTGKYGFDTFTHLRCTLDNPKWVDTLVLGGRFPPYTESKVKAMRKMLSPSMPPRPGHASAAPKRWGIWLALALVGLVSSVLIKRRGV